MNSFKPSEIILKKLVLRIFISIILILRFTYVNSQQDTLSRFSIEISSGLSISNFYQSNAPFKSFSNTEDKWGIIDNSVDKNYYGNYFDYNNSFWVKSKAGFNVQINAIYTIYKNYSIIIGLGFEQKGNYIKENNTNWSEPILGDLGNSSIGSDPIQFKFTHQEIESKISNNYVVIPIRIRSKTTFGYYYELGGFIAFLNSSKRNVFINKTIYDKKLGAIFISSPKLALDAINNTAKLDYGFTIVNGYAHTLKKNIKIKAELVLNIGLKQLDSKYNDDYALIQSPAMPYNSNYRMLKTNNYNGFSSKSKNVNLLINIGFCYNFN